ncbi:hypothetical protein K456DRAFT_1380771 [Colletotrichum gloeosporioides 23]|nr:hypothetical protein K456DRAFT_1380771 [Colletotrichum gloeosporioides 23]
MSPKRFASSRIAFLAMERESGRETPGRGRRTVACKGQVRSISCEREPIGTKPWEEIRDTEVQQHNVPVEREISTWRLSFSLRSLVTCIIVIVCHCLRSKTLCPYNVPLISPWQIGMVVLL